MTHIDWARRQVFVEAADTGGRAKWMSLPDGASFAITRGVRDVLLGAVPHGVTLTRRAEMTVAGVRDQHGGHVADGHLVVERDAKGSWRWWTWAGMKANRTLAAAATTLAVPGQRLSGEFIRLHSDLTTPEIKEDLRALSELTDWPLPVVDLRALKGLKFSAALPTELAARTLSARTGDSAGAAAAAAQKLTFHSTV